MKRIRPPFYLALIDKSSLSLAQVAVVALVIMMVLITVEVFIRKLFGISTKIAHDFSAYLLVAVLFLGAAETLRVGKHLRVTILYDRWNPKIRSVVYKATFVIVIIFVLSLLWATTGLVVTSYGRGAMTEGLVRIPEFIPELLIPIGLFFFVLQLAAQISREFRQRS
ncbi:hypothetical protein ES707_09750 [subsurface metagenome]